jgi:hypothetical protein
MNARYQLHCQMRHHWSSRKCQRNVNFKATVCCVGSTLNLICFCSPSSINTKELYYMYVHGLEMSQIDKTTIWKKNGLIAADPFCSQCGHWI